MEVWKLGQILLGSGGENLPFFRDPPSLDLGLQGEEGVGKAVGLDKRLSSLEGWGYYREKVTF